MNADGTNLHAVGHRSFKFGGIPFAIWSPDSSTIAYDAYSIPEVKDTMFNGRNIFLIDANTGEERTLFPDGSTGNLDLSWSPDGAQIAFVSDRSGAAEVWVIGKDGKNPRQLTQEETYLRYPVWSDE